MKYSHAHHVIKNFAKYRMCVFIVFSLFFNDFIFMKSSEINGCKQMPVSRPSDLVIHRDDGDDGHDAYYKLSIDPHSP